MSAPPFRALREHDHQLVAYRPAACGPVRSGQRALAEINDLTARGLGRGLR